MPHFRCFIQREKMPSEGVIGLRTLFVSCAVETLSFPWRPSNSQTQPSCKNARTACRSTDSNQNSVELNKTTAPRDVINLYIIQRSTSTGDSTRTRAIERCCVFVTLATIIPLRGVSLHSNAGRDQGGSPVLLLLGTHLHHITR